MATMKSPNPNYPKFWLRLAKGFYKSKFDVSSDSKYTGGICYALECELIDEQPEVMELLRPAPIPGSHYWFKNVQYGTTCQRQRADLCRKIAAVLKADKRRNKFYRPSMWLRLAQGFDGAAMSYNQFVDIAPEFDSGICKAVATAGAVGMKRAEERFLDRYRPSSRGKFFSYFFPDVNSESATKRAAICRRIADDLIKPGFRVPTK